MTIEQELLNKVSIAVENKDLETVATVIAAMAHSIETLSNTKTKNDIMDLVNIILDTENEVSH